MEDFMIVLLEVALKKKLRLLKQCIILKELPQ